MRVAVAIMLLSLVGCGVFRNTVTNGSDDDSGEVVVMKPPKAYSRADVDAINAETQCRSLARNMLEAQRCGVRR